MVGMWERRGSNGPLEARFLMNGMLRSWDAILSVADMAVRVDKAGTVSIWREVD